MIATNTASVRRPPGGVLVRADADRIVVLFDDEVVANHPRSFKREQVVYDPWHYLPVLMRSPRPAQRCAVQGLGSACSALAQIRAKLQHRPDGDRQFVKMLGCVPQDGLSAVERGVCRGARGRHRKRRRRPWRSSPAAGSRHPRPASPRPMP